MIAIGRILLVHAWCRIIIGMCADYSYLGGGGGGGIGNKLLAVL